MFMSRGGSSLTLDETKKGPGVGGGIRPRELAEQFPAGSWLECARFSPSPSLSLSLHSTTPAR